MAQLKCNVVAEIADGGKIELPVDAYCRDDLYNILIMNGYTVLTTFDKIKNIIVFKFWKE